MQNYIFLTNESANKGYSSSVKALAATVENPTIIDAADLGKTEFPKGAVLVSAGNMGFEMVKKYSSSHDVVLATDRYAYEDLDELGLGVTLIAPKCEIEKYAAATKKEVRFVAADLVASPKAEVMRGYAGHFISDNESSVTDIIFKVRPTYFFFFGGRVSAPTADNPDNWKENTVEQFASTAEGIMADAGGEDIFFVFHGLRSRTRGDKSNDFAPQNAAFDVMRRRRQAGQSVFVLVTTEIGSTFIVMNDEGEKMTSVNNANAGGYYFALWQAIQTDGFISFTAEQMNLTNEALTLGADWGLLRPVGQKDGWNLTVPANEATHENVFDLLEKGGKPLTQVEAFKKL
ncbi:MAG: hypothetical protein IJ689_00130 [Alphaproteobacteria bacterium]|nr:hypothetical protein [Alphaproteobacteria bacterium]